MKTEKTNENSRTRNHVSLLLQNKDQVHQDSTKYTVCVDSSFREPKQALEIKKKGHTSKKIQLKAGWHWLIKKLRGHCGNW